VNKVFDELRKQNEILMGNSKGRVLIAEDDIDVGAVLALALRLEGYEVQVVRAVAEAQEYFSRESVDLMILDWLLMDGTGDEVCKMARAIDPDLPIIVMSAVLNHQTKAAIKCQPVLFLTKPIRMHVLCNSVQSLLSKRNAAKQLSPQPINDITNTHPSELSSEPPGEALSGFRNSQIKANGDRP
jgi:DNA-binding response OmpR family regulator